MYTIVNITQTINQSRETTLLHLNSFFNVYTAILLKSLVKMGDLLSFLFIEFCLFQISLTVTWRQLCVCCTTFSPSTKRHLVLSPELWVCLSGGSGGNGLDGDSLSLNTERKIINLVIHIFCCCCLRFGITISLPTFIYSSSL